MNALRAFAKTRVVRLRWIARGLRGTGWLESGYDDRRFQVAIVRYFVFCRSRDAPVMGTVIKNEVTPPKESWIN